MKIDRLIVVQNSDDLEHLETVEKFARIVVGNLERLGETMRASRG